MIIILARIVMRRRFGANKQPRARASFRYLSQYKLFVRRRHLIRRDNRFYVRANWQLNAESTKPVFQKSNV